MIKKILTLLCVLLLQAAATQAQNVYVLNSRSQIEPVIRAVTAGSKTSGKAFLALYGAKLTTSMVIDGKSSRLVLPVGANYFYVVCPTHIPIDSWKLAALKQKKKTRELPFVKTSAYSGSKTNIDEIKLRVEKISDEVYRLTPSITLFNGEYLLFRLESGMPQECYDFRVDSSLSPALDVPTDENILAALQSGEIINNSKAEESTHYASADGRIKNNKAKKQKREDKERILLQSSQQIRSDVDIDIPVTKKVADNTFALVISNENYKQAENVPFAHNDGQIFKQYLRLCIGLPDSHIIHIEDASLSDIKYALTRIKDISEAYEGDAKIIIHYSGHGIPDEKNGEGYLLPADGYSSDPTTALKLSDLYSTLGGLNAKSLILFLDACFSGTQKDGSMLASARGVAIKAKQEIPTGKLVVITASQGDQTAFPYYEKEHGLMTYFMLKKLKESQGDATLGDLADYISTNVKRTSLVENGKSQIPTATFDSHNENWRNQTLR